MSIQFVAQKQCCQQVLRTASTIATAESAPYQVYRTYKTSIDPTQGFLIGLAIGSFIIGPIIWTAVGRELAKATFKKGVKVATPYVEKGVAKAREKLK